MLKSDPATWADVRHREGEAAEQLAAELLTRCGYEVIERRYQWHHHDIDIVARQGPVVVFVEVRYRHSPRFGMPAETVTARKRADLARAAASWLQRHGRPGDGARFDVIGVLGERVEWLQSAFRPGWR